MANKEYSLAHTKWMCKYHIIFTPKYRRKVIYNQYKKSIREILIRLCGYKGVKILEGHLMPDHVHMLVSIPPKIAVSTFMGYLKGKSALMILDKHANLKYKFENRHFWAEGYYVSTEPVHQALKIKRIHEIIFMIEKDGDTRKDYQPERDFIVRNIVKDIRHNKELIAEIDNELKKLISLTGYKLHTMPGIDLVTEAKIISEIGDINRFPDSDKLARFMGLALVQFSSAGKDKDQRCRNGNRALNAIFHFLAIQMVAVSTSGKPRHPVFREYFEQKVKEGKNKPQALVCVARCLVRIIYGMMKTKTEYRPYEKADSKN